MGFVDDRTQVVELEVLDDMKGRYQVKALGW